MNQNQFDEVVLAITDECKQLLMDKGKDYSSVDDKLLNFKQAAQFTSCNKWQALEIYFFKHIQAISNWFKNGRKQLNEDIKHRIRDSINYLILLEAMIVEEEQSHESQGDAAKTQIKCTFPIGSKIEKVYYCRNASEYEQIRREEMYLTPEEYDFYHWAGSVYQAPRCRH